MKTTIESFQVVGISLQQKTTNTNGQSHTDCKNLWHTFEDGKYADKISNRLGQEVYGVYHHYDGDNTKPFSYLIGCRVATGSAAPVGMEMITIPEGSYEKIAVHGKMPDCVIEAWKQIWEGNYSRTYKVDYEVYDERSRDWSEAEMDVYVSIKG